MDTLIDHATSEWNGAGMIDAPVAADTATDAAKRCFMFWESERTLPASMATTGNGELPELVAALEDYLPVAMKHPYLAVAEIRAQQLARMRQLVEMAYKDIPVYRAKYRAAGFSPSDLRDYDDIQKIPVITKPELIAAFPDRCVNARYDAKSLYPTRSSGSSGQTLLIRVDHDAIITDTIQGVRQFALQSGLKYGPRDLLTHVYTVPWWFDTIDKVPDRIHLEPDPAGARRATSARPRQPGVVALSVDPRSAHPARRGILVFALPRGDAFGIVRRGARRAWSRQLGVPVLDEYSSEEATRIALEIPAGRYHVCEDTVHLDVLDPQTMAPQQPGRSGLAVVTNLLNEAMPFIRYVQGDYITLPAKSDACDVNWSQIASIDGRLNDAFINRAGRKIAGRQHPRCHLPLDVRLRPASGAVRDRADGSCAGSKPAVVLGRGTRQKQLRGLGRRIWPIFCRCA